MNEVKSRRLTRVTAGIRREKTLREVYSVLFRNKIKVLCFFMTVTLSVAFGAILMPDIYLSTAKLMVRLGRESVSLDPTATTGQVVTVGQERENEINSELEIVNSRELAQRVVEAMGVSVILDASNDPPLPEAPLLSRLRYQIKKVMKIALLAMAGDNSPSVMPTSSQQVMEREKAIQHLTRSLHAEAIKKSNILQVSYESLSPRLARDVVEKLIGFYLDEHINAHRTSGSYNFFNEQREKLRSEVAKTEEALKQAKAETGMFSLQEQRRILLERIGSLQRDLEQTESGLNASAARIKVLKDALATVPSVIEKEETTGFAGSAADELLKRLQDLRLKEQELLSTFTEKSVPVVEIRRQIKEGLSLMAQARQTRQVTRAINATHQQLELDCMTEEGNHSSLLGKMQALKRQLTEAQSELVSINESEVKLSDLAREIELQKANYHKYTESLEQARIDQALEMEKISNISVIQAPSFPVKPMRPNKRMTLALGALLGLWGGIGLAFVAEYLDHSFKHPDDVEERLQLPALATVPRWSGNSTVKAMPAVCRHTVVGIKESKKHLAELKKLYDTLIESLVGEAGRNGGPARVISVTSCRQGEGSSTVAMHLALILSSCSKGRVLLVDANFEHPSVHETFGAQPFPGLAEVKAAEGSFAALTKPSGVENLDLLCSGKADDDLAWLFESKSFDLFLSLGKREYSFVLFDTPPVWGGAHATCLDSAADAVILVIEAERVRWETAQRARDRLVDAGANVVGVVLNKRRFHVPGWLYRTL